jgi:hypothetical protein
MPLRLWAGGFVVVSLWISPATGQEPARPAPPFRIADEGNWEKQQQAVSQAASEGYLVMIGRPTDNLVILRRRGENEPAASYKVVQTKKEIEQELARGYRAVPGTLDVNEYGTPLVMARKADEAEPREVLVVEATRASTLDKKVLEGRAKGFRVVGMASGPGGHAALLERPAGSPPGPGNIDPKAYIAAKGKEAVQQELAASAAAGYRIAQATAFNEMRVALEPHDGQSPIEYRVLAAMRNQTLLEQISAASAEGFTVTPGTLHAVQKGSVLGMPRLGSEYMVVLQKGAGAAPGPEYFIVAFRKRSTLTREFDEAVAAGYAPVAAVIGFQEQDSLVLFERPRR